MPAVLEGILGSTSMQWLGKKMPEELLLHILRQLKDGVTYSSSLGLMATGDGTSRRTPPAIAGDALKAALSWSAVIPALIADICISFCTVSVSCAARA